MDEGVAATDAAVRAGVSREVFVRLIQSGRVKGWRKGRFWEADAADLERFIRESRERAARQRLVDV